MNLYELNEAIVNALNAAIDPETGELIDEAALDLSEFLESERDEKIENIALWIKNLKAEAEALKAEKDSFAKRQKAAENKAEWLKGYLASALNGQKFKTVKCSVSFRSSEAVEITDEAAAIEYFEGISWPEAVKVEKTLSKSAVKDYIKNASELAQVPGVHISEKTSVIIK